MSNQFVFHLFSSLYLSKSKILLNVPYEACPSKLQGRLHTANQALAGSANRFSEDIAIVGVDVMHMMAVDATPTIINATQVFDFSSHNKFFVCLLRLAAAVCLTQGWLNVRLCNVVFRPDLVSRGDQGSYISTVRRTGW